MSSALREANAIWGQAGIQIQVVGTVERTLAMPSAMGGIGASDLPGLTGRLGIRGGVIAVLVHILRGNVHAGLAVVGGRICAMQWAGPGHQPARVQGTLLAHELGHIMGLPDYQPGRIAVHDIAGQLAARNNLMTSSVALGRLLTQEQIDRARRSPWVR
ncbi:MAG: hypothetical protein JXR37_16715 [Kiritimatiellae bacterium]|nr:hypothetical protein [Kiritimatiellia bacterium]